MSTARDLAELSVVLSDPLRVISDLLVLENGQPYGECWQDFQLRFFRAVFATNPDGTPVYRLVYDERRRGESKTEDVGAAAVGDLITGPRGHRSYAVAGDVDQAALILDSINGFRDRNPTIGKLLEVTRHVVKNTMTKAELRVMSSDDRTAFGIRPRKVWFDELSLQPDEKLWLPFWSAIGKRRDAQMIAVTMAGWDFSGLCWKVRELARANAA